MYEEKVRQEKVLISIADVRDAIRKIKGARAELQIAFDTLDKYLDSVHHARQ